MSYFVEFVDGLPPQRIKVWSDGIRSIRVGDAVLLRAGGPGAIPGRHLSLTDGDARSLCRRAAV